MAQLVELTGERRKFSLTNAIVIGRDPHCGVHLADPRVSRRHAELARLPDGRYRLVDLGSTQGTLVSGRRVRELILCHGDELQIGGVPMRFEDAASRSRSVDQIVLSPDEDSMLQQRVLVDEAHEFVAAAGLVGEDQLRLAYERLRAAFAVHEATAEQDDTGEISRSVLALALRVLAADRAAVVLFDERAGQFTERFARTRTGLRDPFSVPEVVLREVCRQRVGLLRSDASAGDVFAESLAPSGAHSVVCVPLIAEGRCAGALYADSLSSERAFGPADLDVAAVIARQGAQALHHAALRHQLRAQSAMEDRLELVERLAGGIAHRFNNSLSVILSSLDFLGSEQGAAGQELTDIREAVHQASALTQELLALGRRGPKRVATVGLDELVQEVAQLRPLGAEGVQLRLTLGAPAAFVQLDRALAQQALVSILRFASRNILAGAALPDDAGLDALGGRTTPAQALSSLPAWEGTGSPLSGPHANSSTVIGTVELESSVERSPASPRADDDTEPPTSSYAVVLRVIDSGPTLSPARAARVFDPFPEGPMMSASSGLGLAAALSVIRQARGSLVLEPLARGNAFVLTLPCVAAPPVREATPARKPKSGGGRALLLVDDEDAVLRATKRALERSGFVVHAAPSGADALARFGEVGPAVDCVVCDVLMPGMNGPEVVAALRATRADLPVLFISGYADAALETQVFDAKTTGFLAKPFSPSELVDRVLMLLPAR